MERRIASLDSLRALAAVSVAAFHFTWSYPRIVLGEHPSGFAGGHYGVQLFFLISGFVIFRSLDRQGDRFPIARAARILPVYWFALASATVLLTTLGPDAWQPTATQVLVNATLTQRIVGQANVDPVYWTLCVEAAFYATIYLASRLRLLTSTRLLWTLSAWLVLAATVPHGTVYEILALPGAHLFAAGIATSQRNLRYAPIIAAAPVVEAVRNGWQPALVIAGLTVVFVLAVHDLIPMLRARWLVWAGGFSYAFYAAHRTTGFVVMRQLDQAGLPHSAVLALGIGTVLALAYAVTVLIEQPTIRRYRHSTAARASRSTRW